VIVDIQRLGPSTGSATRGADGDIHFLRWGNSGGMPVIVLAPADACDCFTLTVEAFNLAERYRCPVFIASNKEIAMTRETVPVEHLQPGEVIERRPPAAGEAYFPFQTAPGEAVPGFLPIGGSIPVRQTSSTHGPDGYITTDPAVIRSTLGRMQQKIERAVERFSFFDHRPADGADTLILSYGVTSRAAAEAARRLTEIGRPVAALALKTLWPVPEAVIRRAAEGVRRVLVAEMNLGQYVHEIARILPGRQVDFYGQMDGRLIAPDTLMEALIHG
jgi:2-oxoglutarate/2-oxoacid ferredoxin oxidoreductase subunit alpha